MTRAHDKAVLARLREHPELATRVFEGEVPKVDAQNQPVKAPQWYVLLHSNRGLVRPERFAGLARRRRKTYWLHSVAVQKGQVDKVAELILGQILNWIPEVDGWDSTRVTHEASQPVQKDDTSKPALYFGVDQFDFDTSPLDPIT